MGPLEEKIYYPLAEARTKAFKPFNKLFTALGIKADFISYSALGFMAGFILALPNHPALAFWFLFARMMADIMDGPLARYQKTDSDRGKFVDVLMDNLSFCLFIIGVVRCGLMHATTGLVYLLAAELLVTLLIISYNIKPHKSDWYFYASAGSLPYVLVYTSYLLFAVWAFGGSNYLNGSAQVFAAVLVVNALSCYWTIQKTVKR